MKKQSSISPVSLHNILVIYKINHDQAYQNTIKIIKHLINQYKSTIYIENLNEFTDKFEKIENSHIIQFNPKEHSLHINLIVTIGGDGTILWAHSLFNGYDNPYIIGFNLGTLGYLSYYSLDKYKEIFENIHISNGVSFESRATLEVLIHSSDESINGKYYNVLNEVVFEKGFNRKMIKTNISLNNKDFTSIRGDGIIISTSTGSTAYNLSCNGPILHYNIDGMILNAICPFSLSFRSIVFTNGNEIKVELDKDCQSNEANVNIDGIHFIKLNVSDSITVRLSSYDLKFIIITKFNGERNQIWIDNLVDKLGFNSSFKN